MRLQDLQELDVNDIESWPVPFKIFAAMVVASLILFAGYWLDIKNQITDYQQVQRHEKDLRQSYLIKKKLSLDLPVYQKQMQTMKKTFAVMLRQLPDKTEIPELLIDITQAGLGRGLYFELFKPGEKRLFDFYAVAPITIKVRGTYHQLANFVSDLAALPRIVTVGNLDINPLKGKSKKLLMTAEIRTYHYLDTNDLGKTAGSTNNNNRRRRG